MVLKVSGRTGAQIPTRFRSVGIAIAATIAYSAIGTLVILKLIALVSKVRATTREEGIGLDVTQHGEEAYSRGECAILVHASGVER